MAGRKRKSTREVVLDVLHRTYPEYVWGYAIVCLSKIYEGKRLYAATLFEQIYYLMGEA